MMLEAVLEEAGFEGVTAADAVTTIAHIAARSAEIRAVLTDIRLGTDDPARRARENVPTMPIVYVSEDSAGEWAVHGVPNSMIIPKPDAFEQIVIRERLS